LSVRLMRTSLSRRRGSRIVQAICLAVDWLALPSLDC
jgi:hypothetical protein